MQDSLFLILLGENVSVYDLIKMFLIEIIDGKATSYRGIDTVCVGDIVVECNAEKDILFIRNFGDLA